ncbi:hypothetical protein BV898_01608 [Hypsibius exemplaris]|uniref:Uncharacterized protein n=1 Tax=Hypsibius exemplaris TaxID=2072580 RepID=A0A1W0XAX3_HYPEX|nr:hypothetical protein BV898_01608 [Hypsibius exemplaris]
MGHLTSVPWNGPPWNHNFQTGFGYHQSPGMVPGMVPWNGTWNGTLERYPGMVPWNGTLEWYLEWYPGTVPWNGTLERYPGMGHPGITTSTQVLAITKVLNERE